MKLLITGAWQATPAQLDEVRALGHEVIWHQQESGPLPCAYEEIEGCICNGLFLYHPIEKFAALRFIQLTSAGFDRVPMDYIRGHKIAIYNARGVYSIPMEEHVLACVLATYRKLSQFHASQARNSWEKIRDLEELSGREVLILGCGSVGTECARRFRAFGCRVSGLDLYPEGERPEFDRVSHICELNRHLPGADIVVVTLPLTPETKHLFDRERFALLKDGALFCNIARGGIVESGALLEALSTGRFRACLDVFEEEPLLPDSPFWKLPNAIVTPHNSFVGQGNAGRLSKLILNHLNSESKQAGESPRQSI